MTPRESAAIAVLKRVARLLKNDYGTPRVGCRCGECRLARAVVRVIRHKIPQRRTR